MKLDELINRKDYEKILHVVRRHWVTYIPTILTHLVLAAIPFAYYIISPATTDTIAVQPAAWTLVIVAISIYELSIALFFYASFLIYYLDMIIITNDRLVEVSQKNLFSREVSELDLYKIQDATSEVNGIVATIFNYGRLQLETAAEQAHFKFDAIPMPHELRRELMELSEEDRKYHAAGGTDLERHNSV